MNGFKEELNLFFHSLQFYTKIPTPKVNYSEDHLVQSFRYFPLVGIIVGGIGSLIYYLSILILSQSVALVLSMSAMALATGVIHEDGLSDFFDGFGGGYTKERILEIMRDSSTGVYGMVALALVILLEYVLLSSIPIHIFAPVLIATHATSRMMPIILIQTSQYARTDQSKGMHTRRRTSKNTFRIALLFACIPLCFIPIAISISVVMGYALIYYLLRNYTERKIGGFTGDVLGALIVFCQLLFLIISASYYHI